MRIIIKIVVVVVVFAGVVITILRWQKKSQNNGESKEITI